MAQHHAAAVLPASHFDGMAENLHENQQFSPLLGEFTKNAMSNLQ
jgi:hypothetical protein